MEWVDPRNTTYTEQQVDPTIYLHRYQVTVLSICVAVDTSPYYMESTSHRDPRFHASNCTNTHTWCAQTGSRYG